MQGRTLTNDQIFTAVDCAIQNNLLPYATNAVYLLLGASNIKVNSGAAPPLKDHCRPQDDVPHKTAGRPLACLLEGFLWQCLYVTFSGTIYDVIEDDHAYGLYVIRCWPASLSSELHLQACA